MLTALLLPYLVLAGRDAKMHRTLRTIPLLEQGLHGLLFLAIVSLTVGIYREQLTLTLSGLGVVAVAGALDEFVYHRGIPAEETDTHAKEHLMLLLFVGWGLCTWLAGA